MKKLLLRIALFAGLLAALSPILMVVLWSRYVREQEQLQGTNLLAKKECEPYNMTLTRSEDTKYQISWQTKNACTTYLMLGQTYADFSNVPYKVLPVISGETKNQYQVTLQKQDESTYRYAVVVSEGQWFGLNGHPFLLERK